MKILAPVLLGQATWEALRKLEYDDWNEFKEAINKLFGMSTQQLEIAFFDMKMNNSESPHAFILRME